ncbi:MAG: TetR/AcrR family transcriptional regulator [Segniliparus sp.]|uniref:TetR/AcrR family transcriptional regulator n=1 Tax=Segniliparus sp. TaxID=2804064 RepID=UPI003F36AC16
MTQTNGPSSRVQRRRARNQARILDAAEASFASEGYSGTRIETVAERADVSVGSVYSHYANKDELYLAVADRLLERAGHDLAEAFQSSVSPTAQTVAAGQAYYRMLRDSPFLVRFISPNTTAPESAAIREQIARRLDAIVTQFSSAIDQAIARGEILPVDSRLMALFLISAWNGVMAGTIHPLLPRLSIKDAELMLATAQTLLLRSLTPPAGER